MSEVTKFQSVLIRYGFYRISKRNMTFCKHLFLHVNQLLPAAMAYKVWRQDGSFIIVIKSNTVCNISIHVCYGHVNSPKSSLATANLKQIINTGIHNLANVIHLLCFMVSRDSAWWYYFELGH